MFFGLLFKMVVYFGALKIIPIHVVSHISSYWNSVGLTYIIMQFIKVNYKMKTMFPKWELPIVPKAITSLPFYSDF